MSLKYVLDEQGCPMAEKDVRKWAQWFENADAERLVAEGIVGDSRISTVFLGLDYNFRDSGPPILWETMVFGGRLNQSRQRCAGSREQALAMHAEMVKRVKDASK